jgi:cytochrome b561
VPAAELAIRMTHRMIGVLLMNIEKTRMLRRWPRKKPAIPPSIPEEIFCNFLARKPVAMAKTELIAKPKIA